MIGLLLLGFWKLQVIDSDKYGQMAERNRVRSIPIIAPRGRMLDRDGRVLVDNYPSFSVLLLRDDQAARGQESAGDCRWTGIVSGRFEGAAGQHGEVCRNSSRS